VARCMLSANDNRRIRKLRRWAGLVFSSFSLPPSYFPVNGSMPCVYFNLLGQNCRLKWIMGWGLQYRRFVTPALTTYAAGLESEPFV
ncbi:MAG TPA: hypothetical protein VHD56_16940, partial [Tepidisphaeraceae bacterium]|nr:hypothetical protein [Tepidisphaeraceae bacterium]